MSINVIDVIHHKLSQIETNQITLEKNQNKINEIIIELQKNIELLNKQILNTHETFNGTLHLLLNKNKINTDINMKTFTNSNSYSNKNYNLNINTESDTESDTDSDTESDNNVKNKKISNDKNEQSIKKSKRTKNNTRIIV